MKTPDVVPVAAYARTLVDAVSDELWDREAERCRVEAPLGLPTLLARLPLRLVRGAREGLKVVDRELGRIALIVPVPVLVVALRV